mmetsp:Transcript_8590/g.12447  ORF Transcript_8590/g.12447 Transcript_8590/m.12447 type:complete len:83 (-) Transcript_8590:22-270(-)
MWCVAVWCGVIIELNDNKQDEFMCVRLCRFNTLSEVVSVCITTRVEARIMRTAPVFAQACVQQFILQQGFNDLPSWNCFYQC